MKRLLVSFGLFACANISAHAADPQAAIDALASAPVASWTGCYAGGNIGGGWSHVDQESGGLDFGSGNGDGLVGGVQAGCDYQVDRWVFGAQAMLDFSDVESSHVLTDFPDFVMENELKALSTFTGRAGYLFDPAVLGYVKAGGAWARIDSRDSSLTEGLFNAASYGRLGWTVGVGAEWKFAANWSVFGEYSYLDFGKHDVIYTGNADETVSTRLQVQQAVFGLNYRF